MYRNIIRLKQLTNFKIHNSISYTKRFKTYLPNNEWLSITDNGNKIGIDNKAS